ncbi:MAG: translation initiation factor IF-3 [Bacilli bacterium]|nr:translation initiation factor IF-3 [Bacilli bacterium]
MRRADTARCFFSKNWRYTPIAYYNPRDQRRPEKRRDPINENVRYPEVRLIGPNGENLGIMSSREANQIAIQHNLDLFCISPKANPPVCKILDYGKYRFDQQKAEKEAKKNQHRTELKQIQLTPQIGIHDIETKARKGKEFLEDGNKVEVVVVFRGRQLSHKEVGEEVMKKFMDILADGAQVDKAPYWEEKYYKVILAPKKK